MAYFGRPADTGGLDAFVNSLVSGAAPKTIQEWVDAYSTNPTVKNLVDSFGNSVESAAMYPPGSEAQFVKDVYKNVRNRVASAAEVSSWQLQITSGTITMGRAALGIFVENLKKKPSATDTMAATDLATLAKKTAVAVRFTDTLLRLNKQSAYDTAADAATARTMINSVTATTDVNVFQAKIGSTVLSFN